MKIEFDKEGYNFIKFEKINNEISIILSSKDFNKINKTIVNSAMITKEQFLQLISDLDLSSVSSKTE